MRTPEELRLALAKLEVVKNNPEISPFSRVVVLGQISALRYALGCERKSPDGDSLAAILADLPTPKAERGNSPLAPWR